MSDFDVSKMLILDTFGLADLIETRCEKYLRKAEIQCNGAKVLKKTVEIPIIGVNVISAYVEKILVDNAAYTTRKINAPEVFNDFLLPEYNNNYGVFELLESLLLDLKIDITGFISDNKFMMCFHKIKGTDLYIEKTIDFRIHEYNSNKCEHELYPMMISSNKPGYKCIHCLAEFAGIVK